MIDDLMPTNRKSGGHLISKIHATLDKHHPNDCAHNTAWRDANGQVPGPFTIVGYDDVAQHKFHPIFAGGVWEGQPISAFDWALKYTEALSKRGRNPLCLWPEHCLIDSWGSMVYHPLQESYHRWAKTTGGWIDYITKGQWPWTEHYSAMVADVPDPTRPETGLNTEVINDANGADIVIWSGWAGSHCLKWTALDAINYFTQSGTNAFIAKSIFLSDASAPVPNPPGPNAPDFGQWRTDFLNEVQTRGGKVMTCQELVAKLR